jgi:hypothetical protein
MSVYTKCISCPDNPTALEMFFLLLLLDSENNQWLNINYVDRGDCEDYTPAFECIQDATFEEVLRLILVEDDCGRCAINLLGNICDVCAAEGIQGAPR